MKTLEKVEELRAALEAEVSRVTGELREDVRVELFILNQPFGGPLAAQARALGWYGDEMDDADIFYRVCEIPVGGTTTVLTWSKPRLTDMPCRCNRCGWTGIVWDCEGDVDGDGSLGCPECEAVIEVIGEEEDGDDEAETAAG